MNTRTQTDKADEFRKLHHGPRILVLPNAWDVASARIFEAAGFPAIATTSAGVAAAHGYPDGERISRREMIAAIRRIAHAVAVPVTADIEAGYSNTVDALEETIHAVITTGVVGINLEDGTGRADAPLTDLSLQVARIKAIRQVATTTAVPLVINARTDAYYLEKLGAETSRLDEAVRRANAYRAAGADCLFVIGARQREVIARLVREINGPVNILPGPGCPTIPELEQLGVARVSVGSGPHRATLGLLRQIAAELQGAGTYELIARAGITHAEVNQLLERTQ